jgi:hypothetical protein
MAIGAPYGLLATDCTNRTNLGSVSLGEMIQGEVRNVTRAAGAVMGVPCVGMIVEHSGRTTLTPWFEDRCRREKRDERPDRC